MVGLRTDAANTRIVIVGAGQAGARAAEALRAAGYRGEITLLGDEPHLPYERPQLSKDVLLDPQKDIAVLRTEYAWRELGVDLRLGTKAVRCDAEKRVLFLSDGRKQPYDLLLLATGASARRLPTLENSAVPVRCLRTAEDALFLRSHLVAGADVVLIGGGVIGLEVAAAAAASGANATVIEAAPTLLARALPEAASNYLLCRHRAAGVAFRFGVTATGSEGRHVILSDGTRVPADIVVIGIGVEPCTALAETIGLRCDNGIPVDACGRTEIEGVFAAGDVALQRCPFTGRWRRVETWANAQNQAIAVARTMAGAETPYVDPPWFWSDQYDANIQVVGDMGAGDVVARGDVGSDRFTLIALDDGIVRGAVTVNRRPEMAILRRLVKACARVSRTDLENPAFDLKQALH